jgi:hypothetical protein
LTLGSQATHPRLGIRQRFVRVPERRLAAVQSVAGPRRPIASKPGLQLVGNPLALIRYPLALVSSPLALVGNALALVRRTASFLCAAL